MKKLLELLKSLKDWQKAGVIIAFFGLLLAVIESDTLKEWISPTPEAEFYLGNVQLDEASPIVLHYFVPVDTKQWSKNIINFPLVIANNSEKEIRNFSLEIETSTIKTTDNGRVRRMFIENSPNLKLKNIDSDAESDMQVLTTNNRVIPAITEFRDSINLNVIDMNPESGNATWDIFNLRISTKSYKCETREFNIEVCCHPMHEEPNILNLITREKDGKTHIAVYTVFQLGIVFKDGDFEQKGGYYKVSRKDNSIRIVR